MVYVNGIVNGALFGLGLFIAEILVHGLFHMNIFCG